MMGKQLLLDSNEYLIHSFKYVFASDSLNFNLSSQVEKIILISLRKKKKKLNLLVVVKQQS